MSDKSFKFTFESRYGVILILFIGVLFNIISFVHFYFSSSRKVDEALRSLTVSSIKIYDDTLSKVDDYLSALSTNVAFYSRSPSSDSLSASVDFNKSDSPILPVVDSIDYDYFVSDGRHIARIGRQDFSDGSPFPRGGVISRVYDDCILLEGGYRVARQNARIGGFSSPSVDSSLSTSSYDELKQVRERIGKL